jgi:hypothetical protein
MNPSEMSNQQGISSPVFVNPRLFEKAAASKEFFLGNQKAIRPPAENAGTAEVIDSLASNILGLLLVL